MTVKTMENPIRQLIQHGQSLWLDGIVSREEFKGLIDEGVRGVTTNPTIFEKAVSGGEEGDFKTIAARTVQGIADLFAPVYRETKGGDGFVSIEVNPHLAYDTAKTVEEARELWAKVGRPNVLVKVPATRPGIPAIQTLIAEGINVNVTLIFSVHRYLEVMEAYVAGLEERAGRKKPLAGIASVASFFVSRVDTAVDRLLEAQGLKELLGKAAVANSKSAYMEFEKTFASLRFQRLKSRGAALQRPLWASTGTKNPAYSDVLYVEELIGPHTVNTLPPATLAAFRDHGRPAPRLKEGWPEALETLERLKGFGVDLDAVTVDLEKAGVKLFADSYDKIIRLISTRRK